MAFAAIHQTDEWTDGQIDKDRDKKKDMETQRVRRTNRLHSLMKIPSLLTIESMFYLLIVLIQSFRSNRYSGILRVIHKIGIAPKGNIKQQGIDSKCKLITVLIRNSHI